MQQLELVLDLPLPTLPKLEESQDYSKVMVIDLLSSDEKEDQIINHIISFN